MYSPEHRAEYVALLCAILSEGGDTVSQAAHAADDAMAEVRARFDLPPREFCDLVSSIDIHLAHDADAAPYRRAAADLYPWSTAVAMVDPKPLRIGPPKE